MFHICHFILVESIRELWDGAKVLTEDDPTPILDGASIRVSFGRDNLEPPLHLLDEPAWWRIETLADQERRQYDRPLAEATQQNIFDRSVQSFVQNDVFDYLMF